MMAKVNLYLWVKKVMWKYTSRNWENISLHDHLISKVSCEKNDILLMFDEGFDVVKTHPLNNTGKSKHTTSSLVVLKNARFSDGKVCYIVTQKDMETYSVNRPFDFSTLTNDLGELEVLQFEIKDEKFKLDVALNGEFAEVCFLCSDVIFCWNDYSDDAWFENWEENIE